MMLGNFNRLELVSRALILKVTAYSLRQSSANEPDDALWQQTGRDMDCEVGGQSIHTFFEGNDVLGFQPSTSCQYVEYCSWDVVQNENA